MTDNQTLTSVTPQVLLGNHLKALKLPTFAREYERFAFVEEHSKQTPEPHRVCWRPST